MMADLSRFLFGFLCMLVFSPAFSQVQSCPANINFSLGSLTNWSAYTGNNRTGNGPSAIKQQYDVTATNGVSSINEFLLPSPGIQVLSAPSTDIYGGFATIPRINGY